jgi:hypothetical protein
VRCRRLHHPLTLPADHGIDPAGSLTARQVIDAWPEIGPTVLVHDVACGWRELRTQPPWECWHHPDQETTTMSTPATPADSPSLEERLAALETDNRELHRQLWKLRLAVAVIALGLILYSAWRTLFSFPVRATVVDAQRVVVRDSVGRVRLMLGTDDGLPPEFRAKDNPGLLLCDEKGALRGQLYASEELTGLDLFDPDGKPRVAVTHRNGWSGCWLKDRGGALRVGMALDAGGGRFVIQDEAERPLLSLP